MKIRIYRKDKSVPLPERKTSRSVGLDVYAAETVVVRAGEVVLVPTGLIIESPPGYYFKIFIRSGFAVKYGVSLANDVGIVDEDYCGPEDEVKIALVRHYNPHNPQNDEPLIIEKGTRIAQIIFEKNALPDIEWDEQDSPDFAGKTRGGFGSTGLK
ncbi:MAG: dUTP diphosphatase [Calditrichaeota bacterium]|nr:dUTP diphosphatase [Calditrichota bacterium]